MNWKAVEQAQNLLATERGYQIRDWGGQVPIVLIYANSYRVGMSSLAIHSLYRWLNDLPGVVCERAFAWLGRSAVCDTPPVTLETQHPLREAAVLAISLSFELDYLNLVTMLRQADIPLRASERGDGDPLVLLGGPAISANPAPLAPLADAVLVGEIEPILVRLGSTLRGCLPEGRVQTLEELNKLPGFYVPALNQEQPVGRLIQPALDDYLVASTIRCPRAEFGDLHLIEISRGCQHACRFCLAGCWYLPQRERSLEQIVGQMELGVKQGQRIGLVAAAVSDYSHLDELLERASAMGAHLSVSSLRINTLTEKLIKTLVEGGERTITLAPEAGSERLRSSMNKGVNQDEILKAARMVSHYSIDAIKLYFMVGLPGEDESDLSELAALACQVRREAGCKVIVNVTPFVPKAHTAWQRKAMSSIEELNAKYAQLRRMLAAEKVALRAESIRETVTQALLARGDRRLGDILLDLDYPSGATLYKAAQANDLDFTYLGAIPADQKLPWSIIKGTH